MPVPKPKRIKPKKEHFTGGLKYTDPTVSIFRLKGKRRQRLGTALQFAAAGGMTGLFGSLHVGTPSFKKTLAISLSSAAAGAATGFKLSSREIRKATNTVKEYLKAEAQGNNQFNDFLKQYKYVFIDQEGQIVGTNNPRKSFLKMKFGRLRIETKDLLRKN